MDIQLAEIIGISRETLLDWLTKFSIPHRRPGTRVFVRMETFYDGLPEGLSDADTKPSLR